MREKIGIALVTLMVLLQAFYAFYAYFDPFTFSTLRGTELFNLADSDWVQIYASRTLFISLIVAVILYLRLYKIIFLIALLGTIMPITDGWLAFLAEAPAKVVVKHVVTVIYLLVTAYIIFPFVTEKNAQQGA